MKYKVGDKVRIKQSNYNWRQVYVGMVGTIIDSERRLFAHTIKFNDLPNTCWNEENLEVVRKPGEQLEFSFMYEEER